MMQKFIGAIQMRSPLTRAPNRGGIEKSRRFSTNVHCSLRNGTIWEHR